MIDRGAILFEILRKNLLRREALLPLLDVKEVFRKEVMRAEWVEFATMHEGAARSSVLRQQRARFGQSYPHSTGGRWDVNIRTARALREQFEARQSCR